MILFYSPWIASILKMILLLVYDGNGVLIPTMRKQVEGSASLNLTDHDVLEQQKTNSWTFYLSPREVDSGRYVFSWKGTIAHIMIFLQAPTCLWLHLLHSRYEDYVELSIQEEGKQLRVLHKAEIYKSINELGLQGYSLDQFKPGRHELQLVVVTPSDSASWYNLRDIVLEFVDSPSESIALNSASLPWMYMFYCSVYSDKSCQCVLSHWHKTFSK